MIDTPQGATPRSAPAAGMWLFTASSRGALAFPATCSFLGSLAVMMIFTKRTKVRLVVGPALDERDDVVAGVGRLAAHTAAVAWVLATVPITV